MKPEIKAAYATIELLASTWPKCFAARPAERELDIAMSVYTGQRGYVKGLKEGAQRVGLDGAPCGAVTAEQAAHALKRIERMEARVSARTRARGLAKRDAALKAKAEAEATRKVAEEAKRAAEIAAGRREPVLRLPRSQAA